MGLYQLTCLFNDTRCGVVKVGIVGFMRIYYVRCDVNGACE